MGSKDIRERDSNNLITRGCTWKMRTRVGKSHVASFARYNTRVYTPACGGARRGISRPGEQDTRTDAGYINRATTMGVPTLLIDIITIAMALRSTIVFVLATGHGGSSFLFCSSEPCLGLAALCSNFERY